MPFVIAGAIAKTIGIIFIILIGIGIMIGLAFGRNK